MDGKELIRASTDYAGWDPVSIFGGDDEEREQPRNLLIPFDPADSLEADALNDAHLEEGNDIVYTSEHVKRVCSDDPEDDSIDCREVDENSLLIGDNRDAGVAQDMHRAATPDEQILDDVHSPYDLAESMLDERDVEHNDEENVEDSLEAQTPNEQTHDSFDDVHRLVKDDDDVEEIHGNGTEMSEENSEERPDEKVDAVHEASAEYRKDEMNNALSPGDGNGPDSLNDHQVVQVIDDIAEAKDEDSLCEESDRNSADIDLMAQNDTLRGAIHAEDEEENDSLDGGTSDGALSDLNREETYTNRELDAAPTIDDDLDEDSICEAAENAQSMHSVDAENDADSLNEDQFDTNNSEVGDAESVHDDDPDEEKCATALQRVYRGYKGRKTAAKLELQRGRELMRAKSSRQKSRRALDTQPTSDIQPKPNVSLKSNLNPSVKKPPPDLVVTSVPSNGGDDDDEVVVHRAVRKTNVPESPAKFHTARGRIEAAEKFPSSKTLSNSTVLPKQYADLTSDIRAIEMMLTAPGEDEHSDIEEIALTNNEEDEIERDSMSSIHDILDIHKQQQASPPNSARSHASPPVSAHRRPTNTGSIKIHSTLVSLVDDEAAAPATRQPPSIKDLQNISSEPIARVPRHKKPPVVSHAPLLHALETETPRQDPSLPIQVESASSGAVLEPPKNEITAVAGNSEGYGQRYAAAVDKQHSIGKARGINKSLQARYACGNCGMLEQGGLYCKRCGRRTRHKSAKSKRSKPAHSSQDQQVTAETQATHQPEQRLQKYQSNQLKTNDAPSIDPKPRPPPDRSRSNPRPHIQNNDSNSTISAKEQPKKSHRVAAKEIDADKSQQRIQQSTRHESTDSHSSKEAKTAKRSHSSALKATDDILSRKDATLGEAKAAGRSTAEPVIEKKPTLLDDVPKISEGGGYLDLYQKKRNPYISDAQSVRVASSPVYNPYEESNSLPAIHEKKQRKNPHGRLHSTKSAPPRYRDEAPNSGLQLPPPVRKSHDYDDLRKPVALLHQQRSNGGYYNRKKSL